jgi:glutamate carboxypeptidase
LSTYPGIDRAERIIDHYLDDLKNIVNIDSGTYNKQGVDHVGQYLQQRFQAFGFSTRFERQAQYGDHLIATHNGNAPNGPRLLLIGHMDTVLADGEAQRRPFTISSQGGVRIATGPGVLDMKSGILIGLYALHLLIAASEANYQSVTFLCNSDEEIGSPSSKTLIQELARQADAALILEPGRAERTVVSSRRGVGRYRVEVQGVSAHAGVEPKRGRNAILELAYQVQRLQALNDTIPGTTLNVGVIAGGERTNVVPAYASCDIDIRVSDQAGLKMLEAAMRRAISRHLVPDTKVTLSGSMCHMPFERTEGNTRLIRLVKEVGHEMGLKIEDVSSGGGSDGNTTSAMGVPTLDGLGAGGALAHNPGEYIELDYLPTRIALVAGLVQRIGR